ncbi:gephyrin-like molybdotransferase Glp [Cyanobacterium aponinum UTEX 3222]|uniref:Molybdopterin molybdenumtransferase n=2 Tax=Cyanobacterium aponinum TaxID=379064 RepID=A0A844GX13_9CHRO|nr:gephyrin-like molybdotransferase Glp [Cyanobacterium aponinum]WRL43703.1 gephyrin-like molybdotransferase Glp [Cyanobacterium aponinum UTEX 3222]MBD2394749.1 molybdopterin molybdotransferase MoeA [Cyanobacterium aponinum FACHB-4101]MTF38725.1 molybdopterin molybdenumtransferase MoeA [Cyanobacterium aponinum 0216]WPF88994.1 molybdopterin molybdotransferase MoeA [Cyanobacterium aponinum AL20115]WRL37343.1 gephyrin-like molybdotransferase Glp [Cyanobacterium aponinum UTEX 3221]
MLNVNEVEQIISDLIKPIKDIELVSLSSVDNRVLAQDITSDLDFPYWDNSAMDGYAVKYSDVALTSEKNPVILKVIEEIKTGYSPQKKLKMGESARIFTGGMLPQGADTIVIQENTLRQGDNVLITHPPLKGEFVRHKGSFYQAGKCLIPAGSRINAPEVAILATAQCLDIPVVRSPRIAIISTGDELISPQDTLKTGKIIDSNQYLIASFLKQNGAIPLPWGIIPDELDALETEVKKALAEADWIISTGGVSVGEYDYVDKVIEKLGGEIKVKNVRMKPGKPLTIATFGENKLYFGIPGNPVSTMVTCWRFLKSAIAKLSGEINPSSLPIVKGITCNHLRSQGTRETYLWGYTNLVDGYYQFTMAEGSHNSGNLINLQGVNSLAIIPVGVNLIEMGDDVSIFLIK